MNYKSLLQLSKKARPPVLINDMGEYKNAKCFLEKEYKSHYAFYKFVTYLQIPPILKNSKAPPKQSLPCNSDGVVNVLGDSHCLSYHGVKINDIHFKSSLCTGLKCKHFLQDSKFFSYAIFMRELEKVEGAMFCLSVGEIDCREGIGGEVVQR